LVNIANKKGQRRHLTESEATHAFPARSESGGDHPQSVCSAGNCAGRDFPEYAPERIKGQLSIVCAMRHGTLALRRGTLSLLHFTLDMLHVTLAARLGTLSQAHVTLAS
jgi:hypothetical protein